MEIFFLLKGDNFRDLVSALFCEKKIKFENGLLLKKILWGQIKEVNSFKSSSHFKGYRKIKLQTCFS